jgi:hypothetical protein
MSKSKHALKSRPGSILSGAGDAAMPIVVKDTSVRRRLLVASAAMLVLGLALFGASYASGLGRTESLFLTIAGIAVVFLAILFFYFSPSQFLRSDVCDALCLTNTEFMYRTLMPLAVSKPLYVPPGLSGDRRTLLRVSEAGSRDSALENMGVQVQGPGFGEKDIFVVPPGYGLMEHAKRLGATFTVEGLEDEMRDVLVNGFELADKVTVEKSQDRISVELRNVAVATLCATLRKRNPGICDRTGCPLCSFVGCMVAEGSGRKAVLDDANVRGKTIRLSFRLT